MARASHRSGRRRQNQGRAEGPSVPRAKDKRQAVGRTGKGRDVRPESLAVDAGPSERPGRRSFGGERRRRAPDLPDSWLLLTMLELAVPLWIHELRSLSADQRVDLAHAAAQVVAEKGDILQFRSKAKGGTAAVFNETARGLAALAYQPGGVKFCGIHWEAKHAS